MSGPIFDLETLAREYAVEGWTWTVEPHERGGTGRHVFLSPTIATLTRGRQSACFDGDFCWDDGGFHDGAPAEVAITVCCAALGVPTPWRLAERLDELVDDWRTNGPDVANPLAWPHRVAAFERAAAMARGES
jgi:hypothetical protein